MNNGGPAFPVHPEVILGRDIGWQGMTLRDYFASRVISECMQCDSGPADWARDAYAIADAMLQEGKKNEN